MSDTLPAPDDFGQSSNTQSKGGFGDQLGAEWANTLDPKDSLSGVYLARRMREGLAAGDTAPIGSGGELDVFSGQPLEERQAADEASRANIPQTSKADAQTWLKNEGLTESDVPLGDQDSHPTPVLRLRIDEAHDRKDREAAIARGPDSFFPNALGFVTSMGVGMIDPVNMAAFSIPVLGEARTARMIAAAGDSLAGRAGIKAVQGGVQGAVGTAALQPADWWLHTQDGQDYTMSQALESVVMGAGMGGIAHAAFGGAGDLRARAKGLPLHGSPTDNLMRAMVTAPTEAEPVIPPHADGAEEVPGVTPARTAPHDSGKPAGESDAAPLPSPGISEPIAGRAADDAMLRNFGHEPEAIAGMSPNERAAAIADARRIQAAHEMATSVLDGEKPSLHPGGVLADLPDSARRDAVQTAMAAVISGQPVQTAEMLNIAADHDPRIAESIDPYNAAGAEARAADTSAADARVAVHNDVRQKLLDAGMSEDEASHNAAVVASRYATRAERLNGAAGNAMDLYRGEGLEIRSGEFEGADGRSFDQRRKAPGPDLFAEREADGQTSIPGTERIGDGELAQRKADEPLKPGVAQKPMDVGLFGDDAAQKSFFQSHPTVPTFYSAVARAVDTIKQEKASPEQWLATLKNMPGVKAEEMKYLGLEDWLKEQKGSVSKADVQDYIRANAIEVKEVAKQDFHHEHAPMRIAELMGDLVDNVKSAADVPDVKRFNPTIGAILYGKTDEEAFGIIQEAQAFRKNGTGPTRYPSYKLPGGENYRELLLTLPERRDTNPRTGQNMASGDNYRSSHWEEPNILAHVRFDDRVSDGKKTLHVAEVQSDWHQAGKRNGYDDPVARAAVEKKLNDAGYPISGEDARSAADDGIITREEAALLGNRSYVPDAPFKTTWPELAMKRMIRYAAENGYERISWDTGETSAARYDLSKQVDEIKWSPEGQRLEAFKDGRSVMEQSDVSADKLPDIIGKEAADKIVNHPTTVADLGRAKLHTLSGVDLKVGGEGMAGFYDKILPATVNKLVKKFGAKVEQGKVESGAGSFRYEGPEPTREEEEDIALKLEPGPVSISRQWDDVTHAMDIGGATFHEAMTTHGSMALAEAVGGKMVPADKTTATHAVDITPELRKAAVDQGFPLFQNKPVEPRQHGIPEKAGEIVSNSGNDKAIKAHPDYAAAKAGDEAAAQRLVEATVDPATIEQARQRFGADAIYAPIVAEEASGHNAIPHALAVHYADAAGGKVDSEVVQTNRAYHTGAGPMERLANPAHFGGEVVKGGKYVIVDDVSVMGSTIAAMADHIQKNGGEVAGVVTLANASRTGVLRAPKAHIADIERRYGHDVKDLFGTEPAALTGDEAQYIRNFRDADALRSAVASADRKRQDRLDSKGIGRPEGEGLSQPGAEAPRGRITLSNSKAIIELFKGRDPSTFMHESSHLWLDELMRDSEHPNATDSVRADRDAVLKWLGVDKAEDIGTLQHERWAEAFEKYLGDGEAPSSALASAFEQFKKWMREIYRAIAGTGETVTPEIKGVMDRLLASDREIASRKAAMAAMAEPDGVATKAVNKVVRGRAAADPQTWSLFEYLASKGGLKPDPELHALFGGKRGPMVSGFGPLLRHAGMTLDDALTAAKDGHYMFDAHDVENGTAGMGGRTSHGLTPNDLLDLIDQEHRGQKVYRSDHLQETSYDPEQEKHVIMGALEQQLEAGGEDVSKIDPKLLNRAVEIVHREGISDVMDAYERAIYEDEERFNGLADELRSEPATADLPGWDVPDNRGPASGGRGSDPEERGQAGQPLGGPGGADGEEPRAAGEAGRSSPADAAADPRWRALADVRPDYDEPDVLDESRAADHVEEPASTQDPERSQTALEKAAADAEEIWKQIEPTLSEEERALVNDALEALKTDKEGRDKMISEGVACLVGAVM